MRFKIRSSFGNALFEVILAMGLLGILSTSVFSLLPAQYLNQSQAKNSARALVLSEEGLKASRVIRDKSWPGAAVGSHGVALQSGNWSFQGTEDVTDGMFHRTVTVTDESATQKKVVSKVSWQESVRARSVELVTHLTNWQNATAGEVWGDWSHPIVAGSVDLGSGNQGTGLAVSNKIIYAPGRASNKSKPDFYVIDARDVYHPNILGNTDTGNGLVGVVADGSWAFAITDDQVDKLQVIDVSFPNNPALKATVVPSAGLTDPVSIALMSHYVLIGSKTDSGGEFGVINISNPLAPEVVSVLAVQADVNSIAVKGDRAYLATSKDDAEIIIMSLTDPAAPSIVGTYDIPGAGDARSVQFDLKRNRAYVAREKEGAASNPEIVILDIANINNPQLLAAIQNDDSALRVIGSGHTLFSSIDVANMEFQVYDISNPVSPVFLSSVNYPEVATDMALEDNVVYVSVRSNDAIKILTAQ